MGFIGLDQKRRVDLRSRDLVLLKLAYDHGFILTEHAVKYFNDYRNTRRRIFQLLKAGYFSEQPSEVWFRTKLLILTAKGRAAAETHLAYRIDRPHKLRLNRLAHDSHLIHARQRLDELWEGNFICENRLASRVEIPDGVYSFESGRRFYVELENNHKAKKRFLTRLQGFEGVTAVLYIATNDAVERSIKRTLAEMPTAPAALIQLGELRKPTPTLWSAADHISLFHRKDF